MKKLIALAGILAVIAVAGAAIAFAQNERTANVEVRVWQRSSDHSQVYISARPEGGSWRTLGTVPLGTGNTGQGSEWGTSGAFRYSDITLEVRLPAQAAAPMPSPTPTPSQANYIPWIGNQSLSYPHYTAQADEFGDVRTTISTRNEDGEHFIIRCWEGRDDPLNIFVTPFRFGAYSSWSFTEQQRGGEAPLVRTRIGNRNTYGYWAYGSEDSLFFFAGHDSRTGIDNFPEEEGYYLDDGLLDRLSGASAFLMRFSAASGVTTVSWDIEGMSDNPAWQNIVRCGDY